MSEPASEDDPRAVEYEVEVEEDDLDEPIEVSMEGKFTRLVVRVRPTQHIFSA